MIVLIADDHPMVRDALARTVLQLGMAVQVQQASDFDGLAQLPALAPLLPVVVASGHDDPATVRAVLSSGAAGFVPKTSPAEVLLQALRIVLAGGVFVPPQALADLRSGEAPTHGGTGLTPRQGDVLRRLMRGLPNKLIARELGLTEGTVTIHIAAILRVLKVHNRTEAVVRARELGIDE